MRIPLADALDRSGHLLDLGDEPLPLPFGVGAYPCGQQPRRVVVNQAWL